MLEERPPSVHYHETVFSTFIVTRIDGEATLCWNYVDPDKKPDGANGSLDKKLKVKDSPDFPTAKPKSSTFPRDQEGTYKPKAKRPKSKLLKLLHLA